MLETISVTWCLSLQEEIAMDKRLGLGRSAISKCGFELSRWETLRRLLLVLLGVVILGAMFFYFTREIQSSTAHATRTGVHWEPPSE